MTVRVIQIGLDPDLIDFTSPDFAIFPGLEPGKLRAAHERNMADLRQAGFEVDGCLIDFGETAEAVVRNRIRHTPYDAVLIGAGIRLVPSNTRLFETLVNLVHTELPAARFVFNQGPAATPGDVLRWFPDPVNITAAW